MALNSKRDSPLWKDGEVETLIDIYSEETIQFNIEKAKCPKDKNAVYNEVKVKLENRGIVKSVTAITTKLKKLRAKYKTEKDKLKRSGTSRPKKPWKFFDKLDQIFKDNPSIHPQHLMDSSKEGKSFDVEPDIHDKSDINDSQESEPNRKKEGEEDEGEEGKAMEKTQTTEKASKARKTKLEKTIESICSTLVQNTEEEMKRYEDLEKLRHERELHYRLEMQKLESERRREERQHELNILQMLMQTRGYNEAPPGMAQQYGDTTPSNSSYCSDGDGDHSFYRM